jgi:hypothetical protein
MRTAYRTAAILLTILLGGFILSPPGTLSEQSPLAQQVLSFTLVNADLDIEIGPLENGFVIDCALLKTFVLNVRANTKPMVVGSVKFGYDANPAFNIENSSPYFLVRNNGPDWNGWTPTDGVHTITATPYTGSNATGTAGTPLSVTFTAASCSNTPTPSATTAAPDATETPGGSVTPDLTHTPGGTLTTTTSTPGLTDTPQSNATVTPTPTPTGFFNVELLTNRSFEDDVESDNIPDYWMQKGATKDKRKCNKDVNGDGVDDKIVASDGRCVYQFKSAPGENSKLMQKMGVSGDPTRVLRVGVGDTLTLTGEINAKGAVDIRVKVRVIYKGNNPPQKGKITLRVKAPTSGFQPFPGENVLSLEGEPDIIKVQLQNRGTSGKVRLDNMSLILDRQIPSFTIPLP